MTEPLLVCHPDWPKDPPHHHQQERDQRSVSNHPELKSFVRSLRENVKIKTDLYVL